MEIGIAYDLRPEVGEGGPGDWFEEYDSPETIDAVAQALKRCGHRTRLLGGGRQLLETLLERPPELVFNMAEGTGGRSREAHVAAVCELLGVAYTHSDPLTLAACLDKAVAKTIVAGAGVPTPRWCVVDDGDADVELAFPLLAKPLAEGSSIGLRCGSRCDTPEQLRDDVLRLLRDYGQPVLVEEFCPGQELTVGILGSGSGASPLGVMEIVPLDGSLERFVYSVEVKRLSEAAVEYRVPPASADGLNERAVTFALAAYRALGCRDVARVDLRVDAAGEPAFLELNPLPGLRPGWGDIVLLSERVGVGYEELIHRIVLSATARQAV
jgi:D-alanine-D-alanine ligase